MDERHLVDMPCKIRKNLAHMFAAFTVLSELEWRLHQRTNGARKKSGLIVETF